MSAADPRLDRLPEFDARSRGYQVRDLLEDAVGARAPRSYAWPPNTTLDQGSEGACVGFACAHRLAGDPIRVANVTDSYALDIYRRAQQLDEWPGEDYSGTSVLAGMKVMRERGLIDSYRWVGAGSGKVIEDVIDTLGYVGPIVLGIPWLEGMYEPRPSGLLDVSGSEVGGHALTAMAIWLNAKLTGESRTHTIIGLQNSWGPSWGIRSWGQGGMAYVKAEDLERLLNMSGEGAVPLETVQTVITVCPTCGQPLPAAT